MFWARFFFDNKKVGASLKRIARSMALAAKILTILVSIVMVIVGVLMLARGSVWGVLVMFLAVVPELALFCGMIPVSIIRLYAFGELIDRISAIDDKLSAAQSDDPDAPDGQ